MKKLFKKWWFWVIIIVVVLCLCLSSGSKDNSSTEEKSVSTAITTVISDAIEKTETTKPQFSLSQRNAIEKAKDYIRVLDFSKTGLIDQLEFEGFSEEDSKFAVDHIEVDWNEECYKKAESYMKLMNYSEQGLRDQLDFEGFTQSEIDYAVNKIGY